MNVTDQQKAVTLLGSGWHLEGGKAVPYMTPAFYYENLGHIDPLSLNSPASEPLDPKFLPQFNALYERYMDELNGILPTARVMPPAIPDAD
jgi:hypothetical protein